jgi:hypothetical protein
VIEANLKQAEVAERNKKVILKYWASLLKENMNDDQP